MLVQIAIILLGIVLVYLVLASRGSHGAKASMKLGLILLVIVMIVSVLNPVLMTRIANIAGIGRGADLLLYAVTGAFLFYALTQYLKSQSQRDLTFRLARRIALIEAESQYASVLAGGSTLTGHIDPDVSGGSDLRGTSRSAGDTALSPRVSPTGPRSGDSK